MTSSRYRMIRKYDRKFIKIRAKRDKQAVILWRSNKLHPWLACGRGDATPAGRKCQVAHQLAIHNFSYIVDRCARRSPENRTNTCSYTDRTDWITSPTSPRWGGQWNPCKVGVDTAIPTRSLTRSKVLRSAQTYMHMHITLSSTRRTVIVSGGDIKRACRWRVVRIHRNLECVRERVLS